MPARARLIGSGLAITLAAGLASATTAQAASCAAPFRYAASTNTIYVTAGTVRLSDIRAGCASAPLELVDAAAGTWILRADLVLQGGARLDLHGPGAGGDVAELRLRSAASSAKLEVSAIIAQYGTLDIEQTRITSWDEAAGGPDLDWKLPPGATADARARAFVRAVSYMDAGTPRESTMNVRRSDLGHLGYNAAESYGVSYKARGCGIGAPEVCEALDVSGEQTDSRFHHNYIGSYTWNAYGMSFLRNEYDNNVSYGLDPHDDSDFLTVIGNRFHHNGNHGFICSQRCNDLVVTGNTSDHNGVIPYVGPGDDDPTDNQVHGIMLHRGVTNTLVADNDVHDQPNGAGIAVFDSEGNTVRDNRLAANKYGVRLSVGSRGNTISRNTIRSSGQYAVFAYRGSDPASYTNPSGRPSDNTLDGNEFAGSGSNVVKLTDSDRFTFTRNTVSGSIGGTWRNERGVGTVWSGSNALAGQLTFTTKGIVESPGHTRFTDISTVRKVQLDAHGSSEFVNADGSLDDVAAGVLSVVTPTETTLLLTAPVVGTSTVTVTPQPVRIRPSAGSVRARASGWSITGGTVVVTPESAGQRATFTITDRRPGAHIQVTVDGAVIAAGTADSAGRFSFGDTLLSTASRRYTVASG